MRKIILFLLVSFTFINTSALTYGGCEYSAVSRMKSIVKNINISYDYSIINNEVSFSVTLNNLTPDIYFYDNTTKKNYYYSDTNNGEITIYNYRNGVSGSYKFYSNNPSCLKVSLGTKYYNLPVYNRFYGSSMCADIQNYSLCQKWANIKYTNYEFEKLIEEYKSQKEQIENEKPIVEYEKNIIDKIIDLYIKYYYYFFGVLIIVCSTIIFVYNKKNNFKL